MQFFTEVFIHNKLLDEKKIIKITILIKIQIGLYDCTVEPKKPVKLSSPILLQT